MISGRCLKSLSSFTSFVSRWPSIWGISMSVIISATSSSKKSIQKTDKTVAGGNEGIATGIAQCGDDLVTILDFEKSPPGGTWADPPR